MFLIILHSLVSCRDRIYPIDVFPISKKSNFAEFMKDINKCMKSPLNKTYESTNTENAKKHYEELQKYFDHYAKIKRPRYFTCDGPFLETEFIKRFRSRPLSYFSPFIPLFIPWFTGFKDNPKTYNNDFIPNLLSFLKPEFLYLVLSESDYGFISGSWFLQVLPSNVFVLSASGMGHVAIPWIQCDHQYVEQNEIDHLISFVGNPRSIQERIDILSVARAVFGKYLYETRSNDWEKIIARSKFTLSPRGIAVATYRTFEILRMGVIPIIITDYIHWLPYYPKLNWSAFSIISNSEELPRTAMRVLSMGDDEYNEMKKELRKVSQQFFQWEGVFKQIDNFFSGKDHCLSCSLASLTY